MNKKNIIVQINKFLNKVVEDLSAWLMLYLPKTGENWWHECVIENLTFNTKSDVQNRAINTLYELDLSSLIRIANKNWYVITEQTILTSHYKDSLKNVLSVRNNWAHINYLPGKDSIINDLTFLYNFFQLYAFNYDILNEIRDFTDSIKISNLDYTQSNYVNESVKEETKDHNTEKEITEKAMVYLVSDPTTKGMVFSVSEMNGTKKYDVFLNGELRTFYEGQIVLYQENSNLNYIDMGTLQSHLTAYQINNPSVDQLYSLNSARIDFVPYQFRPALKLLQSDEPRLLIADSVGVGKTIEAGLIVKELAARSELDNILIICPKPLVAERKWELEMQRFDEEFIPIDGPTLKNIISDIDRDGEWPSRFCKAILPFSLLKKEVLDGQTALGKKKSLGLNDLDPAPHFNLVIVDEAHHIRNSTTQAYAITKYLCDHADAVLFLTATPLQTGNDDLYTLLNLLRPDVVIDKASFMMMARPNKYISSSINLLRTAKGDWIQDVKNQLDKVNTTQWGENIISRNPLYIKSMELLEKGNISREQRVQMIADIESLHSFHTMISRTRRKDIQDFCVRRTETIETEFTKEQRYLHDSLLKFEATALAELHNVRTVPFMISTLRRQAASCIFGLSPIIKSMLERRFVQILDDPDFDLDEIDTIGFCSHSLEKIAREIIEIAENLPIQDVKFDSMLEIVKAKQNFENNKIIIFSTFRHTLAYIKKKLERLGYRVAQIDGSVKDAKRLNLRGCFELPKSHPEALDILLFTEVGCEGLDYQFCDMMINYDLPWNPMKIEQRIGRIDRRGQKSDAVNIYNLITSDTVDANIYHRCLCRIGIFEASIGECEEILGGITKKLENIIYDSKLTEAEKGYKLEQMADNEIRKLQEIKKLESEEKHLFGFDISTYTTARKIQNAENPWISPSLLQIMIQNYFNKKLGDGNYIIGKSENNLLRISEEKRSILLEDFKKMSLKKSIVNRIWERYLKGNNQNIHITFDSNTAEKNRNLLFITPVHPLTKQAAKHFIIDELVYVNIEYSSEYLPQGEYPFSIYAWNYKGVNPQFKLVPIIENNCIREEINQILSEAVFSNTSSYKNKSYWDKLEEEHLNILLPAISEHKTSAASIAQYRIESISNSFISRKILLEQQISDAYDPNIIRMRKSELEKATTKYEEKVKYLEQNALKADIHSKLLINGILKIRSNSHESNIL